MIPAIPGLSFHDIRRGPPENEVEHLAGAKTHDSVVSQSLRG